MDTYSAELEEMIYIKENQKKTYEVNAIDKMTHAYLHVSVGEKFCSVNERVIG